MVINALFIVLIIIIIIYIYKYVKVKYDKFSINYNTLVPSSLDNKYYHVHKSHEGMQIAADTFSEVNYLTTAVIDYIYDKYKNSINIKKKKIALLLKLRYNENNLRENSPLNPERDTSYTINKGEIIAMCIRSGRDNHQVHSPDLIMFVVLHEITHMAITSYDHPDEFWEAFKFILIEAEESGIYISEDYSKYPQEYCGITINYNPRFDDNIFDI